MLAAPLCKLDLAQRLRDLGDDPARVEDYLRNWKTHVEYFCELLRETRHFFLVGRGPSLAATGRGALIIKESDHFHAEGMSSAAFRHGPFEMLQPGTFVGVFAGEPELRTLNDGLLRDALSSGAQGVSFASNAEQNACQLPAVHESLRPIVEILPSR